jgi:two-component system, OmpR family, phosphate regulon sensor histidine kinase PhoR
METDIARPPDAASFSWQRLFSGRQTYLNILYLLAAFPLGIAYFVFLITGLSVGFATLIIWIGAAILVGTMVAWSGLAGFERALARNWLGVAITTPPPLPAAGASRWQGIMARFRDPMTWTTLLFLLLKFPYGIVSFSLALTLLVTSFGVGIVSLVIGLITTPFIALGLVLTGMSKPERRLRSYLLFAATGFGLGIITFLLIDRLAAFGGYCARSLLGMSDEKLRLRAMAAQAAREHERAEQADQRRRQLIVDMSHELRTPVASISGHLESLMMMAGSDAGIQGAPDLPAKEALSRYLQIAHQETDRLATLIDELLSLARMESDELRLDMRSVAAREVIEEVYQVLAPLAVQDRRITIVRGVAPDLPPVLADRQRLVQILLNLVRNAIKYTPDGGVVSLSAEIADEAHVALVVADNGVGIPAEDLDHVFERFYRADTSRTRATGGFGLGLAIVHDLVVAMGGSVSVESVEGAGSTFRVTLRVTS